MINPLIFVLIVMIVVSIVLILLGLGVIKTKNPDHKRTFLIIGIVMIISLVYGWIQGAVS